MLSVSYIEYSVPFCNCLLAHLTDVHQLGNYTGVNQMM